MVSVSIKHDLSGLTQKMSYAQRRHVPFAAAKALTQVAENVRLDVQREIKTKLHAPTDWTVNSLFKTPAKKRDWPNLEAMVYVKTFGGRSKWRGTLKSGKVGKAQAEVLGHLFEGGARRWKGFEAALMRVGVLPAGMAAVPGKGAPLNAHGNIPSGFIRQMVSYFQAAERGAGYKANMTDKGRDKFGQKAGKTMGIGGARVDFFVSRGKGNWFGGRSWQNGRMQHLPPGIWMRAQAASGTALKPILMFVRQPRYQRYFDMEATARAAIARDFGGEFNKAMRHALETAW